MQQQGGQAGPGGVFWQEGTEMVDVVRVPPAVQTCVGGAGCRSDVSLAFESWEC